jgi:hypothetical protein
MKKSIAALLVVMMLAVLSGPAAALTTEVTVRVLAKGAKFVGTSMGGAMVTIRDADTGELLAQGVTAGGTGDTERIMVDLRAPGAPLTTAGAAAFTTTLDIERPRLVEISAFGPLAQRQSANRISVTQWIVPGRHVSGGDGVLLELPGFVVDVLAPPAHVKLRGVPQAVTLRANVAMMCGCPVKPGGVWDAGKYEVKALVKRNGVLEGEVGLAYAGTTSQFAAELTVRRPGAYEAVVYAYDPANGNTGLDSVTFIVTK